VKKSVLLETARENFEPALLSTIIRGGALSQPRISRKGGHISEWRRELNE
jgi:hypothetical protein